MSHLFEAAGPPVSELARPRILSPNASVRVSPLTLGAMSLGNAWGGMLGEVAKEQSFKLLDAFYAKGGNFIDTAVNYQDGQSELIIGDWMRERGNRHEMVIATKFTTNWRIFDMGKRIHAANFGGNSKKCLHVALQQSLKSLQTDYIDILYVHWWDWATSIEELMDSLDAVVKAGKVLYLGASDMPAWVVSAANTYAKAHGKSPFVIYQGRWNVGVRDFEREILPMARSFGMALAPWDVLGGGRLQTKKQLAAKQQQGEKLRAVFGAAEQTPDEVRLSAALEKVAGQLGVDSIQAVALAYVMAKAQYVFPLVGGRKVEHLEDNIKALSIKLSDEQIKELESAVPFELGFPSNFLGTDPHLPGLTPGFMSLDMCGVEWQKDGAPIGYA